MMFEIGEKHTSIQGPVGQLELLLTAPAENEVKDALVIICHPHPLQQGTMNNKVVYTLSRTFDQLGCKTVRFNFRGVGESQGHYGHGQGETEDCLAVMDWCQKVCPSHKIYLAGFSFGAYVAANVTHQRASEVSYLVNIAPAVTLFNFFKLHQVRCPWLVIYGDADEVVPPHEIANWVRKMEPRPKAVVLPDCGHFFHGRLTELRHTLTMELASSLS